jgi:hypothetical protein
VPHILLQLQSTWHFRRSSYIAGGDNLILSPLLSNFTFQIKCSVLV